MSDAATYEFGNVEHPPFIDRLIPDSQNRRWDNLGQRVLYGACQHSMWGNLWGTDGWFRNVQGNGLTDYGIGNSNDGAAWDGVILRWNDPEGRAHTPNYKGIDHLSESQRRVSPNRSPWANGGSNGLEGDGPAYVRKFGVNAINRNLISIERSDGGSAQVPMSPKQFESMCRLTAHWFDKMRVPWDDFPLHPEFDIVTYFFHLEFATKDCPFPAVYKHVNPLQNRMRALMKLGQTAEGDPIEPPVKPTDPDKDWPNGWTTAELAKQFGRVVRINADGSKSSGGFDESGIISNAWVGRAVELGISKVSDIPPPLTWHRHIDSEDLAIDILTFDGKGSDNWCLFRPAPGIAWRWLNIG
jgi:hypothetical protein